METTQPLTPDEIRRIRGNLTQAEFAKRLAVHTSLVSHWETGHREPSGPVLLLLRRMHKKTAADG